MTKGDHLGAFELLVLAALQRLGEDAYGVTIRQEIERIAGRHTSMGAVHATLARLAEKRYVTFQRSAPLPVPGGRARKYAYITAAGRRAFQRTVSAMFRMVEGLEPERGG